MVTGVSLAELIEECIENGCNLPAWKFENGCRFIAGRLGGSLDDGGLDRHFRILLNAGDRLAAALLLLPGDWGYSLHRDNGGQITATVFPPSISLVRTVQSDEEGAALLAAIAVTWTRGPVNPTPH